MRYEFDTLVDECDHLAAKTFSLIELIEMAGVTGEKHRILRKKLLNLGNDIKRLADKAVLKEGD